MQYCVLGTANSKSEEQAVIAAMNGLPATARTSIVDFVAQLSAMQKHGFDKVKDAWIETDEPRLALFTGRMQFEEPTSRGGQRIFAAVEIDAGGRPVTLIKLRADYTGKAKDYEAHKADALDRYRNGKRIP